MTWKTCRDCNEDLPLTEFYRHPETADGYLNSCKLCRKDYAKRNYLGQVAEKRSYESARNTTPERRKQLAEAARRHRVKYPEKYKARTAVGNALRDGRLHRGPCEVCGTTEKVHAHHDDYSKPLQVRWLCFQHHIGGEHERLVA